MTPELQEQIWDETLRSLGLPTSDNSAYHSALPKTFKGRNMLRNTQRSAMFFKAYFSEDHDALRYCKHNGIEIRTQSGKENSLGGVFVIPEIEQAILDLRIEYGVFRRNAKTKPMKSEALSIRRRKGGLKAYPVGPGASATESTATWDALDLLARKWSVLTKAETDLNDDAPTFIDELITEMAYAFTYAEDDAGFNGDGTGKYHGVVGVIEKLKSVDANPVNIKGIKIASGNLWSEITRADILALIGLLPKFARREGNVKWYCSHEFWANVLLPIEMNAGGVSYTEIDGETYPLFIGKPVEFVEVMPTVEANSQIPLLYGNLTQAASFGDRQGVNIRRSGTNGTEFNIDVESIKGTVRFDINVHDVGDTENAGPIVGLMTASS